jgi:hypothetical protein
MVHFILVQFIIFVFILFSNDLLASGQAYPRFLHGEKKMELYSGSRSPQVSFEAYRGKISFQDEVKYQNFFRPYLFENESEYSDFIKLELYTSSMCTNQQLETHTPYIQYAYRLLVISYLLEANWHMELISKNLLKENGCSFNFDQWLKSCRPVSGDMKKFLNQLGKYRPKYKEILPPHYSIQNWIQDFKDGKYNFFSHFRINEECGANCETKDLPNSFKQACEVDQQLMTLACSEKDEFFGLSFGAGAYQLLAQSNIINTFNKEGEALGCLRRFSDSFAHREVKYKSLNQLFVPLREHLHRLYQERFIQGRVFFYGSAKEFEEKGLTNLHVMDQPLKISKLSFNEPKEMGKAPVSEPKVKPQQGSAPEKTSIETIEINTIQRHLPQKSSFLTAAEFRQEQNLDAFNVDMNKLKYDYVFSLNTLNSLSLKLKSFMTRDALKEMKTYDKLGSPEGPVPLLFIKYMIDMHEHTGLYNLLSVLGDEFFVSNEIDASFATKPERIRIENGYHTENQWQLVILKP